ncbi:MAG: redoxin family protein [Pseudomonadota bacterium]
MFFRFAAIMATLLLMASRAIAAPANAPEFTQTSPQAWINSPPVTLESLRGNVVLVDFWTFACWNCYRSFPWLNGLEAAFEDADFQIIGVHSPEFDYERERGAVIEKVKKFELKHPIMIDNDFAYWKAMNNRYWPAFYLIDGKGRVRHTYIGETHEGDKQAKRIEADIKALLAEANN